MHVQISRRNFTFFWKCIVVLFSRVFSFSNLQVTPGDYKPDEDPKTFTSTKTGRGPLTSPTWKNEVEPVMTCYKLVTIEFKWWGIQKKVEDFIFQTEKRLFLNQHRQVFCWIDKW